MMMGASMVPQKGILFHFSRNYTNYMQDAVSQGAAHDEATVIQTEADPALPTHLQLGQA